MDISKQIINDFVPEMTRDSYIRLDVFYTTFHLSGFFRFSNFRFICSIRVIIIKTSPDETGSLFLHSEGSRYTW